MGGRGPHAEHLSQLRRQAPGRKDREASERVDQELADDDNLTVSGQLREYLAESHLTISALARGAGVTRSQIRAFMREQAGMSMHTLDRVCRFLGLGLIDVEDSERGRKR